jgi:hypothetical protein
MAVEEHQQERDLDREQARGSGDTNVPFGPGRIVVTESIACG